MDAESSGDARTRLRRIAVGLAEISERERRLTMQLREQRTVPRPVPESVLHVFENARRMGEIGESVDPQVVGEVIAAVYFDTLSRSLVAGAGFDGLVEGRDGGARGGQDQRRRSPSTRN